MENFNFTGEFPASADVVFGWHERPGAFERLNPPWAPVRIVKKDAGIRDGARVSLRVPFGPIGIPWDLEHRGYVQGREFSDVQIRGPFRSWKHRHIIEPKGAELSVLHDKIEYQLPFNAISRIGKRLLVEHELERVFRYRHSILANDLKLILKYPSSRPLKILISGASGLVGSALVAFLGVAGHQVWRLVRRAARIERNEIFWDPEKGVLTAESLEGFDAVIHLSGENVAGSRWSEGVKKRIHDSRIDTTQFLNSQLSRLKAPPKTFICASAIGYYGSAGEIVCDESSPLGSGFLCEVADGWEKAASKANDFGARTVLLRIGIILSPQGGALSKMLLPFLAGAGGIVGDGMQYMSWIGIDDVIGAIYHSLMRDDVIGPVNLVAPRPVNNLQFTKTLGAVLRRPTLFPLPKQIIRTIFGEMGETLLLGSTRVIPRKLEDTGYSFLYPELKDALAHQLGRAK
jgi:uncharacterized protein (TIGR01777 family)